MNFDKIYILSHPDVPNAMHVKLSRKTASEQQRIDRAFYEQILTGERVPNEPIRFKTFKGKIAMDQITTALVMIHLLSDRVFNCLKEGGFTGWSSFPVAVDGPNGEEVRGYRGLSIIGKCGPFEDSKSVLTTAPLGTFGVTENAVMMGLYFAPETWDKSDIFIPKNTNCICMVDKVKIALEEIGATNMSFVPLSQRINHTATLKLKQV